MAVSDPIIEQRGNRLTIRLPARPERGWTWLLGIPLAAPFIAFGLMWIAPELFGGRVTINAPAGFEWVARGIAAAFGGVFVLLGGALATKSLMSRFGYSEIILTRGRIRVVEQFGFLFLASYRSLATLTRLDVVKPPMDENTDGDPLMNLEAYFSDASPFELAKMYPARALRPIARELVSAIPDYGGSTKVIFAGPPPLSPTRNVPAIVPPPQRKGELGRPLLDRSGGTTRVTIPPYPAGGPWRSSRICFSATRCRSRRPSPRSRRWPRATAAAPNRTSPHGATDTASTNMCTKATTSSRPI